MKIIFTIIFILNLNYLNAGNNLVVSPNEPLFPGFSVSPPVSGQDFSLWSRHSGCGTSDYKVEPEIYVGVMENDVRVFFKEGLGGNTWCVSPPPPIYISRAEINGLSAGTYTLSTYAIPFADDFPPIVADYPDYFTGSFQFGVINGPVSVDLTTDFGLVLLILIMLLVGIYFKKMKFILDR